MSTTTISLPDDLKAKIAAAAKRTGKSTDALILEAISEKMALEERLLEFHAEADARMARIEATGETIAWAELRPYLQARAAGKSAIRPKPTNKRG